MNFLDMFSGGPSGFRYGMESEGHNCIGGIEKDESARKVYESIYGRKPKWKRAEDVSVERLPDFEVLCAGFPCQPFSIAGECGGFEDTRGTAFFEIARIVRGKLPKILFLENVSGLLNHANGKTFRTILSTMDELGYRVEWQKCYGKYHGIPQNKPRIIIIGHLRGESRSGVLPIKRTSRGEIQQQGTTRTSIARTFTAGANSGGNHSGMTIIKEGDRYRRLTPRESWRLQGFPDWLFDKAKDKVSDTELYRQAGNAICPKIVQKIASKFYP